MFKRVLNVYLSLPPAIQPLCSGRTATVYRHSYSPCALAALSQSVLLVCRCSACSSFHTLPYKEEKETFSAAGLHGHKRGSVLRLFWLYRDTDMHSHGSLLASFACVCNSVILL